MSDILYEAAVNYQELINIEYYIVLGRKNKEYHIHLKFLEESFHHLIGLQHLTDIHFPTTNKKRIYKEILSKRINIKKIQKSEFYSKYNIENRINNLVYLSKMLEEADALFRINNKVYAQYTNIKADYLCQYINNSHNKTLMLFIKEDKKDKEYRGVSFFQKDKRDYTYGTSQAKLLLNIRISNNIEEGKSYEEIYRNPRYDAINKCFFH